MMRDHAYPLSPDVTLNVDIDNGDIKFIAEDKPLLQERYNWFLEVDYQSKSKVAFPAVSVSENTKELFSQYFEPGQSGSRLLNLSGASSIEKIKLKATRCQLNNKARLMGFLSPDFENNGPVLIVAPHPDDAELAAYGLYRRYSNNVWIVTLTAGETQKRLDKQYIPGLDQDSGSAGRRKGRIRAWNSITTPLLADVPFERNIMLGYFNDTLSNMLKTPEMTVPSRAGKEVCPGDFRVWNRMTLDSDSAPKNCGEHLVRDLQELLERIKPGILVVTHPEVDPHADHVAAAKACALAMRQSGHQPEQVLMYANHLAGVRGFPLGPAHAAAGVWPWSQAHSSMGLWRLYSEYLDMDVQKDKVLALDTMHDLRTPLKLEKRLKRWLRRYLSGIPLSDWKDYGAHDYFQTHIKAHEVFASVPASAFVSGLLPDLPPAP
ncbi:MAG: PIG-L family deacetylase [Gammaproteobacteria bacterium]|nr:PIG-L family deacetylase [Gammaproteobacteria bacterium]